MIKRGKNCGYLKSTERSKKRAIKGKEKVNFLDFLEILMAGKVFLTFFSKSFNLLSYNKINDS